MFPQSVQTSSVKYYMCSGDDYTHGNNLSSNRARAIKYRQENNEPVGGFFSQIGDLYVVHHLWGE